MEKSLRRDIDELTAGVFSPMKLTVVDDAHTAAAFGNSVFRALQGRFATAHVTLPPFPRADVSTAEHLKTQTLSADALVAVGGGTISDLCKYVSHAGNKPFIVFPTAASMNGYLSANASISRDGHKKTLPAHMPKAVFCDVSVLASAPSRLGKAGLGDSLARPTAQADWLLSHRMLQTPYDETPFALLAEYEPDLFDSARGIAKSDPASIALLMKVLLLSGLGMTIAGGSYPASGGEHLIAHAMEMALSAQCLVPGEKNTGYFHGEAIGVTTLTMARMQEKLLRDAPRIRPNDFNEQAITALYGEAVMREAKEAFGKKINSISQRGTSEVVEKISGATIPPARLEAILKSADAPAAPEDLGWSEEDYHRAVSTARYLRERFTFLDLA